MPAQARYCSRSHRQRAFESRDAARTKLLRRRVSALRRQVAAYDACVQHLSKHPVHGADVQEALLKAYVPLPDEPGWENRAWTLTT
jgi:hypothetical protein